MNNGSFAYMLGKYGFSADDVGWATNHSGPNPSTSGHNLTQSPIYFILAGFMYLTSDDNFRAAGADANVWGSTSSSAQNAGYFQSYLTTVSPTVIHLKWHGFSLH